MIRPLTNNDGEMRVKKDKLLLVFYQKMKKTKYLVEAATEYGDDTH